MSGRTDFRGVRVNDNPLLDLSYPVSDGELGTVGADAMHGEARLSDVQMYSLRQNRSFIRVRFAKPLLQD